MFTEIVLTGGIAVAILGVFGVGRLDRVGEGERLRGVAAVRLAMRSAEAGSVRAEYRRSGIVPPERERHFGFTWWE